MSGGMDGGGSIQDGMKKMTAGKIVKRERICGW